MASRTTPKGTGGRGQQQARPVTFDHLKKKPPLSTTVPVYLDAAALEALVAAQDRLDRAEEALNTWYQRQAILRSRTEEPLIEPTTLAKAIEEARAERDKAEAAVKANTAHMRFQSIGRKRYDKLVLDHPPSEEQNKEHQAEHGSDAPYNVDTFAPALVAASCIEPQMTYEDALILFEGEFERDEKGELVLDENEEPIEITPPWNAAEVTELFVAALQVNNGRRVVELGKASG